MAHSSQKTPPRKSHRPRSQTNPTQISRFSPTAMASGQRRLGASCTILAVGMTPTPPLPSTRAKRTRFTLVGCPSKTATILPSDTCVTPS